MKKHSFEAILRWLGMIKLPVFITVIIVCLVLLIGFEVVFNDNSVHDDTLVISFFGILATFIVISQYAQVTEIKNENSSRIQAINKELEKKYKAQDEIIKNRFEKQDESIETLIKEKGDEISNNNTKFKNEINERVAKHEEKVHREVLDTAEFNSMASKVKRIVDLVIGDGDKPKIDMLITSFNQSEENITTFKRNISENIEPLILKRVKENCIQQNQLITYMLTGTHKDLLVKILRNEEYLCSSVQLGNGDKKQNVIVKYHDEKLEFLDEKGKPLADIRQIDDLDFNTDKIYALIDIFNTYYVEAEKTISLTTEERALKVIAENLRFLQKNANNG